MARRRKSEAGGIVALFTLISGAVLSMAKITVDFITGNKNLFIAIGIFLLISIIIYLVIKHIIERHRRELLNDILSTLNLENIDSLVREIDDSVVVKSRQTLNNYTDIKYLKDKGDIEYIKNISETRKEIQRTLINFLKDNEFKERPQYKFVSRQLDRYVRLSNGFRILIEYISSAGNNLGNIILHMSALRVDEIYDHPEYLMTKGEYNKLLRQQAKEDLDDQKHDYYDWVNGIIDFANKSKEDLIVKSKAKKIDELIQNLFDRTVNSIQKVKTLESDEWDMLEDYIADIDEQIKKIVLDDKRISDYYASDEFAQIKQTCELLTQSRREFNEYISEKAQSISKLFGTRVVRNETQNEDVYNYIRAYKKSITPFTAEVSAAVFGSAENNPIGYIIKYFYPDKGQYKEQITKLKVLIEELETLKEAKVIIDNYKKDYDQYIQNVPDYVLESDEAGFYSRLGLTIIDEAVLNVEYRFTYTSGGGMAQRSFTVPMSEENITELINQLESKLSMEALAKEQRAMMTTKLRTFIKERDKYTCCQCRNSIEKEPNLLLEVDHIIPIAKGGLTREDNLQTLCWKCNRNKGAKLVTVM